MKILEVIPSFEPLGGAENFVFNLALRMKTKGHDVTVVSLYATENPYVESILRQNNIELIHLDKKKGIDLKVGKAFEQVAKALKSDIIHLHLNTYLACLKTILKHGERCIYTIHSVVTENSFGNPNSPRNRLIKRLMKRHYMHPVTISNVVDDTFKAFFGRIESSVIYNGIDISRYVYRPGKQKKYDFISVGRYDDVKNNLFMIRCVERLIREGFDVQYIVLGNGKNYDVCKRYCVEHGLSDRIHLPGAVNNVEEYLSESDCLLLGSHYEGNPLVVNEAIASGVWVVANRVGGVPDIVNERNGYLAEAENEEDFVVKMKLFLENRADIVERVIPLNIERNRQSVDLNNACDQYLELMEKMTEGK